MTGTGMENGTRPFPTHVEKSNNPAHFVLIHGAGHGAWCWYKLRNLLEQSGHRVTCVDLLASGINLTPSTAVLSFDDYNRPLDAVLLPADDTHAPADQEQDCNIILVGHSAGCLSVTRAIHDPRSASRLAAAVYIAGPMLRSGYQALNIDHRRPWLSGVLAGVLPEEDKRQLLYNRSPPEDAVLASMLIRPTPVLSVFQEARWDGGGPWVDDAKRVFVKTSGGDRIFDSSKQEQTVKAWPPSMVFQVESDHSPFFSATNELCDVLLQVAADCDFY